MYDAADKIVVFTALIAVTLIAYLLVVVLKLTFDVATQTATLYVPIG